MIDVATIEEAHANIKKLKEKNQKLLDDIDSGKFDFKIKDRTQHQPTKPNERGSIFLQLISFRRKKENV